MFSEEAVNIPGEVTCAGGAFCHPCMGSGDHSQGSAGIPLQLLLHLTQSRANVEAEQQGKEWEAPP